MTPASPAPCPSPHPHQTRLLEDQRHQNNLSILPLTVHIQLRIIKMDSEEFTFTLPGYTIVSVVCALLDSITLTFIHHFNINIIHTLHSREL